MPHRILVTRALTEAQREYARAQGLEPHEVPLLHVARQWPHTVHEALQALPQHNVWAVTSQHAAKVIAELRLSFPEVYPWERLLFATVGQKTGEYLAGHVPAVLIAEPQTAVGLAETLMENAKANNWGTLHVLHLCGNLRRKELQQHLVQGGHRYTPLEVYETQLLEPTEPLPTDLRGAVFASPSAVQRFLTLHLVKHVPAPYVAIGPSTARWLQVNQLEAVQAAQPTIESLFEAMAAELAKRS